MGFRLCSVDGGFNARSRNDDVGYYKQQVPAWARKISSLLTHHQIRIATEDRMYIAQIKGTGDVALTEFHQR